MQKLNLKLTFPICKTCLKQISDYGYPCKELIKMTCDAYSNSKPIIYSENDGSVLSRISNVIKFMEEKGFIVTREQTRKEIYIYPNITRFNNKLGSYCWCTRET